MGARAWCFACIVLGPDAASHGLTHHLAVATCCPTPGRRLAGAACIKSCQAAGLKAAALSTLLASKVKSLNANLATKVRQLAPLALRVFAHMLLLPSGAAPPPKKLKKNVESRTPTGTLRSKCLPGRKGKG